MKYSTIWNRWLFSSYQMMDAKSLSAFRVFYCISLLFFGFTRFAKISKLSPDLYHPKLSLARWFDLPGSDFFFTLDYLIPILIVFLLFGFQTRWTSLALGCLMIIGNSFLYSFGKINHGSLLITFLPIVMSFSNWGVYFSVDVANGKKNEIQTWPISVMSLIIGFGMFTAGLQKLAGGWLDPNYQAVKYRIYESYLNPRVRGTGVLTEALLSIKSVVFWEAMDYIIVIFEIGFLMAVVSRKLFGHWIVVAIFFHIGIFLTMNISFAKNVLIYILFLDWFIITKYLKFFRIAKFIKPRILIPSMMLVVVSLILCKYFFGKFYAVDVLHLSKLSKSMILFSLAGMIILPSYLQRIFGSSSLNRKP